MNAASLLTIICGFALSVAGQPFFPVPLSVSFTPLVSASGHSCMPLLADDRRHVVFLSNAKNLVTNDNLAPYLDVFRHDLLTGETILLSRNANRDGGANADIRAHSISSNAQWIVFASRADDLLPASDANGGSDIFVTDATTGIHSLASLSRNGATPENPVLNRNRPLSDKPRISSDGRWVAFESSATNLIADVDTNNESDVFLRDTLSNRTVLISVARDGETTANGKSELVSLTPDGHYILFTSTASDLIPDSPVNGFEELYVHDVAAGQTALVEHDQLPLPYACRWASISRNGRFVLYKVEFPPSATARVFLYDTQSGTNVVVSTSARAGYPLSMSSDGRFIAFDESNRVFLLDRLTDTRTEVGTTNFSHSPIVSDDGAIVAFVSAPANSTFQLYYRNVITGQLRGLTDTLSGSPSRADHHSSSFTVDPAGEFVIFDSPEDNLVLGDQNRATDIFIHDVAAGDTRPISRAHPGSPAFTPVTSSRLSKDCVSADGNRVLFFSEDSNLAPHDTNLRSDAFVRNVRSAETLVLSTNESGTFAPTNTFTHGRLSANGRFALLTSLVANSRSEFSTLAPTTILRKDLDTGETLTVVSNARPPTPVAFPVQIPTLAISIAGDGRWVAYYHDEQIFVTDIETGMHTNLTPNPSWLEPQWYEPQISIDARYVMYVQRIPRSLVMTDMYNGQQTIVTYAYTDGAAFTADSGSIVYGSAVGASTSITLYSISTGARTVVCANCWNPQASAAGRFVAYQTPGQVEVKDILTGTTTLISRNIHGTGGANAAANSPVISADSRFIAYTSKAANLTPDPPNGWNNLFVYDRLQGATIRITGARGNTGYGSGSASKPVLGPDGRTLVFQSFASDFVPNDFNDTRDIFLLKLGEGDNDNDGMSDSWEQTHFNTTDRDGTGDFDQDGSSDLAEYLAGTNPNNTESVLEVLQITSVNTGQRQLIWRAQPGKSYRLEYKSDLANAIWTSLGQVITATAPSASALDTTATSEKRFYRVALVQ